MTFRIGDKVKKNPYTWEEDELDQAGRGVGIGIVVGVIAEATVPDDGLELVEVQWPDILTQEYAVDLRPALCVGDKVVKNPDTWEANEFDQWGRGVGVGVIVEPPYPVDDLEIVDVRWPNGRCFEYVSNLRHAT